VQEKPVHFMAGRMVREAMVLPCVLEAAGGDRRGQHPRLAGAQTDQPTGDEDDLHVPARGSLQVDLVTQLVLPVLDREREARAKQPVEQVRRSEALVSVFLWVVGVARVRARDEDGCVKHKGSLGVIQAGNGCGSQFLHACT
jgi:hypothetical protein